MKTSNTQKKYVLLYPIISIFFLLLSNCAENNTNPTTINLENKHGQADIKITLSKIASVGKRSIELSKLYISLSALGEIPILDTIEISGNELIMIPLTYTNLASLKKWNLIAESKDNIGNIIHSGKTSFDVRPHQTATVSLNLYSKYSILKAHYYPIPDNTTKCELILDDTLRADSSFNNQTLTNDTVTLNYDYMAADINGISHSIKLNVYGIINNENRLLYTGDTTIIVTSGDFKDYTIYLHWVDTTTPPPGKTKILVTLGKIGTTTINGKFLHPIKKIAAGVGHSLFIKIDNTLWAMGWNEFGQLGDGTDTSRFFPVLIMKNVLNAAGGIRHSLILKNDNTLWATGRNNFGQLGDGTNITRYLPIQIMTDVKDISAGASYSLILKTDNTLWATGRNDYGQLCDGTDTARNTPIQIMTDVLDMEAGYEHTLILKTDHTLWVAGRNKQGQLGDSTNISKEIPIKIMDNIRDIMCGAHHTLVLKMDNTLWTTGENWNGQLGDGSKIDKNTFKQILTDVLDIGAGNNFSFIIKTDHSLWAAGWNGSGQLGDGTVEPRYSPIFIMKNVSYATGGANHSLILKTDNTLWATGNNYDGQIGIGAIPYSRIPVPVIMR